MGCQVGQRDQYDEETDNMNDQYHDLDFGKGSSEICVEEKSHENDGII